MFMKTIDTTNVTPPENEPQVPKIIQKLGNTTYEVHVHFSKTSKETMTDKIMRLIRNEVITEPRQSA